jgi:hypothetical protein
VFHAELSVLVLDLSADSGPVAFIVLGLSFKLDQPGGGWRFRVGPIFCKSRKIEGIENRRESRRDGTARSNAS